VYTRMLGISGRPLRDSFHVGQTIINDYGRPYAEGFNNITGSSQRAEWGRFSMYVRGEYQHAPQFEGYSQATAEFLTHVRDGIDNFIPNPTIPFGKYTDAQNNFRLIEANTSMNLASHEISFGKSDVWFGPALGGAMGYSNNAEDIYSFRINRVEPLFIPWVSKVLGPIRYDFLIGSLKGHTAPNNDWTHSEGFSFKPTSNVEIGFERTIIWGGKGHQPVTLHTFLKGFFDISDTTFEEKIGRNDPGARFSSFNFTWRLPYLRHWMTLYADSTVHDDVTPPSAPRRSGIRPGIYLAQFPGAPKLDLRVEGVYTDPPTGRSIGGSFLYWEAIQRQAYTNKGFIFGDWIGREAKGGQAWLTYHLSGNEYLQLNYRRAKAAKDFIDGGTTQDDYGAAAIKRLGKDVQLNVWLQYERWKVPLISPQMQTDVSTAVGVTWYPKNLNH
jgi:Capsule assembly protein Wzi